MIVPDVNLLLYAYDATSPFHSKAAVWWRACLSGNEPIGLAPIVIFGFLRVGTSARAFRNPLSASEAIAHIRSWLRQPPVQVLNSSSDHAEHVLQLLENIGTAGNLVTDAQIAALAIEHEAIVHTSDADFLRFPGLRWFNPITGVQNKILRKVPPREK
jgi:hypothetical protein